MSADHPEAFPRSRRLKRRRLIRPLFSRRPDVHRVTAGSVHVLYRWVPEAEVGVRTPFQVMTVPGRGHRTNVQRNAVRRALREAFRPLQPALLDAIGSRSGRLTLALLYRGRGDEPGTAIHRDVPRAIARLLKRLADDPSEPEAA